VTVVVQSRRPDAYPFALFRNDEPADMRKLNIVDVREVTLVKVLTKRKDRYAQTP
jgi:hypothetical protein